MKKQAVSVISTPIYFQGTTCDYLRRAGVDNLIGQKNFAPLRICCPVSLHILYFSAVISGYRAIYWGRAGDVYGNNMGKHFLYWRSTKGLQGDRALLFAYMQNSADIYVEVKLLL